MKDVSVGLTGRASAQRAVDIHPNCDGLPKQNADHTVIACTNGQQITK